MAFIIDLFRMTRKNRPFGGIFGQCHCKENPSLKNKIFMSTTIKDVDNREWQIATCAKLGFSRRSCPSIPMDKNFDANGLCCTNPVRDSSRESSMVAGWHEQT
ncbi:hypothetical protein, partial [Ruixingdingia sedimenti]